VPKERVSQTYIDLLLRSSTAQNNGIWLSVKFDDL